MRVGGVVTANGGFAGLGAVGMPGDADAAAVDIVDAREHFHGLVGAVAVLGLEADVCAVRVAVTVLVDGQHDKAAPCVFDIVEILHFLVVVPSVDGHDRRGGRLRRRRVRYGQYGAHGHAGLCLK